MMKLRSLVEKAAIPMLEWMHDPAVNHVFRADFASMTRDRALLFIQGGHGPLLSATMPSAMTRMSIWALSASSI